MLLPAIQYGEWKAVKQRLRGGVTRIKRGESIVAVMTEGGMLDTATTPGMLMVGGLMTGGRTAFHCFAPWKQLLDDLRDIRATPNEALEAKVFNESLTISWGVLGLLVNEGTPWFHGHEERYEPFLRVLVDVWGELDAVGPRYYGAIEAKRLWAIPNSLHYVLANMGVPHDLLRGPLPLEGPRGLLRYARAAS
jgi:hypothetical protein